jgi:hypothetical protein
MLTTSKIGYPKVQKILFFVTNLFLILFRIHYSSNLIQVLQLETYIHILYNILF